VDTVFDQLEDGHRTSPCTGAEGTTTTPINLSSHPPLQQSTTHFENSSMLSQQTYTFESNYDHRPTCYEQHDSSMLPPPPQGQQHSDAPGNVFGVPQPQPAYSTAIRQNGYSTGQFDLQFNSGYARQVTDESHPLPPPSSLQHQLDGGLLEQQDLQRDSSLLTSVGSVQHDTSDASIQSDDISFINEDDDLFSLQNEELVFTIF
jgi:hypothetical protein